MCQKVPFAGGVPSDCRAECGRKRKRPHKWPENLVPRTGFEPVISALRGRCPEPLDERGMYQTNNLMAGVEGVEPSRAVPETGVLPLDDTPVA